MKIFFITKKLAGVMLMPLQFSLVLIVFGVVLLWMDRWRRLAQYLVTVGTVLLLVFSNRFVGYHLVHGLESRYPPLRLAQSGDERALGAKSQPAASKADDIRTMLGQDPLIVVLSGGASDDPLLPVIDRLTSNSALRVVEAAQIYRSLASSTSAAANAGQTSAGGKTNTSVTPRVLISGGPTLNAVPEALPMQQLAESLGIPSSAIVLETRSDDTASEARDVLPLVGHKPFILVTSAFHMPRAMGLFRRLGMQPIPAPSNYMGRWTTKPFVMNIPPDTGAVVQSEVAGHERLGMFWEHLRGQL